MRLPIILMNAAPDRVSHHSIVPCWHRTPRIKDGYLDIELTTAELHANISVTEHRFRTLLFISGCVDIVLQPL